MINKKKYLILTLLGIGIGSISNIVFVNAEVDAYLIKNTKENSIYEYKLKDLKDAFILYKLNGSSTLYKDFHKNYSQYGLYALHDNSGKYIDYKEVDNVKNNSTEFDINRYIESDNCKAMGVLNNINTVVVKNGVISTGTKEYNIEVENIDIEKGITSNDRFVKVVLKNKNPKKYTVNVLGEKLRYLDKEKCFIGIVMSDDDNEIKDNIKVREKVFNEKVENLEQKSSEIKEIYLHKKPVKKISDDKVELIGEEYIFGDLWGLEENLFVTYDIGDKAKELKFNVKMDALSGWGASFNVLDQFGNELYKSNIFMNGQNDEVTIKLDDVTEVTIEVKCDVSGKGSFNTCAELIFSNLRILSK